MKTASLIIILASLIAGCATSPPPISKEELAIKRGEYMICLVPYVSRFDDGISDARTIANAMAGACPNEYNALFDALTRNDNANVKRMLHAKRSAMQSDIALEVVLNMRARAR